MGLTRTGIKELCKLGTNVTDGDGAPTSFGYLALGTGDTVFANTQTALVAEIVDSGLERAAVTGTNETTSFTGDTMRWTKTWTASGSKTLKEIGVFNDSSAGEMLERYVLTTPRALVSGDTYSGTISIVGS